MRDIKRRIKSVNSTKQITKAMELVASSKMKKARERLEKTRPYFNAVRDAVGDIIATTKGVNHELITPREVKKSAYIVISADRGLAGGYNANVIKAAAVHMQEKDKVSVIAIGQKARDYFRKRNYDLDGEFTHISEDPTYADAQNVGRLSVELYRQGLADEVYLVYTEFISTISYNPKVIKLLPLEPTRDEINEEKGQSKELMSYEPSPEAVLGYLIPKYIDSTIYGALMESAASYQSATKVAMENATENAEEIIDKLQLQYNRARQASITQEITEIIGGAEALS